MIDIRLGDKAGLLGDILPRGACDEDRTGMGWSSSCGTSPPVSSKKGKGSSLFDISKVGRIGVTTFDGKLYACDSVLICGSNEQSSCWLDRLSGTGISA